MHFNFISKLVSQAHRPRKLTILFFTLLFKRLKTDKTFWLHLILS